MFITVYKLLCAKTSVSTRSSRVSTLVRRHAARRHAPTDGATEGGQQRDQDRQKADGAAAPSELLAKVSLASVDFALDVRQRLGVRTEAMICAR